MTTVKVSFSSDIFDDLMRHLSKAPESVAFMRASEPNADGVFRVEELRVIDSKEAAIREDHCALDEDVQASIIKWAWDEGGCLIEAHSHGLLFPPTRFSRFDIAQLKEWVPHVRWRLGGRAYVALVTASREIDGIAWCEGAPQPVTQVLVDGRESIVPTGLSIEYLEIDYAE